MDLSLSVTGDYVVRAALALARGWETGDYRKIRDVAKEMSIPPAYTPQILGSLARAGVAEAKAGRTGGYRLARAPEKVTILEVVKAGEGPLTLGRCTLRGGPCRLDDPCAAHPIWSAASDAVVASLAKVSLADLAASDKRRRSRALKRAS